MARKDISVQIGGNRKAQSLKDYCKDGDDWKCMSLDGKRDFSDQIDDFTEKYKNPFTIPNSIRADLKDIWRGLRKKDEDKNKNKGKDKDKEKPITKADQPPAYAGYDDEGRGLTKAEYQLYADTKYATLTHGFNMEMQDSVNSAGLAVQNLVNEANALSEAAATGRNVYSEDAASWRTDITTQRQKDASMYGDAMRYKATVDAENIRGQYGLDLAEIMKAGNAEVSKIQGEYMTANTQLQGEYNLAGEKIRGAAARDVAQRNKEASMFGSFLGGFWS